MRRSVIKAGGVVSGVVFCAACAFGPGGETTCQEYAAMNPDTGLMAQMTDEQRSIIRKMLSSHDRSVDAGNIALAEMQIVSYCNIYGGQAGSHQGEPIENIPGLSED